jgi:N-acetylglucosamine kinase-like BadF-type ATPase
MTGYFLGIDGGATSGKWTLLDEAGAKIASGSGGPIDGHVYNAISKVRLREFLLSIDSTLRENIVGIYSGLTGISTNTNVAPIISIIAEVFPNAKVHIEQDVLLGYRSHFQSKPGIFLYAGTGSVAVVKRDAHLEDIGGWGFILGDEGAGFWIGVQALRHMTLQLERKEALSLLSRTISSQLGVKSWDEIREFTYSKDKSEIANISRIVINLASEGENSSLEIIERAALELSSLVERAKVAANLAKPRIVFGGGIARSHPIVAQLVAAKLNQEVEISEADYSLTAAQLALEADRR